jgi:alanyl-tRNA synthetase
MTERIYLHNPYIKELSAKVIKKEYSNGSFYVVLNRTIFYPHMSGGQPRDKGVINNIKVINVFEDGNDIVHVLEEDVPSDVKLCIDWKTRFDHMQQHTGQHILSAAFSKLFNAETIGFHLGTEYVYIDVSLSSISEGDVEKIERYANEIVFSNFEIKQYIIGNQDISEIPLKKQPVVEKNIRIVEIDNIDYSPCSGTHHSSTGEVGLIKIRKWEKYKGNIRIEFVCGNRALNDYRWKNNYINKISSLLSVKDNDTLNAVNRIYNENKNLLKEIKSIKNELLHYKSIELLQKSYIYKGLRVIKKKFKNMDLKEIRYIASEVLKENNVIVIFGIETKEKCHILMGKSRNIDFDISEIFNLTVSIIGGQGGGTPFMLQGGGYKTEKFDESLSVGFNLIKQSIK